MNNVEMDTRSNELTAEYLRRKAEVERIGLFSSGGRNIGHAGKSSDVRSGSPFRGIVDNHPPYNHQNKLNNHQIIIKNSHF